MGTLFEKKAINGCSAFGHKSKAAENNEEIAHVDPADSLDERDGRLEDGVKILGYGHGALHCLGNVSMHGTPKSKLKRLREKKRNEWKNLAHLGKQTRLLCFPARLENHEILHRGPS